MEQRIPGANDANALSMKRLAADDNGDKKGGGAYGGCHSGGGDAEGDIYAPGDGGHEWFAQVVSDGALLRQDREFSGLTLVFEQIGTPEMPAGGERIGDSVP